MVNASSLCRLFALVRKFFRRLPEARGFFSKHGSVCQSDTSDRRQEKRSWPDSIVVRMRVQPFWTVEQSIRSSADSRGNLHGILHRRRNGRIIGWSRRGFPFLIFFILFRRESRDRSPNGPISSTHVVQKSNGLAFLQVQNPLVASIEVSVSGEFSPGALRDHSGFR